LPGREAEAMRAIEQAITYGAAIGAGAIHVMAGVAAGPEAHHTFITNLQMACEMAKAEDMIVLIEPLNRHDAPGYFLGTTEQARAVIAEAAAPNLRLMFDCYHVGRTEGDVVIRLQNLRDIIGHIQFASVPDRGTPDHGAVDYREVFAVIEEMQWTGPLGAEYKPVGDADSSLGWMDRLRYPSRCPGK